MARLARLLISPEVLLGIAQGRFEVVREALPPDVVLRQMVYDPKVHALTLVIEHPSFEEIEKGMIIPILDLFLIRRIGDDE